jgi:predicted O-methyltransferase YrrM
MTSARRRLLLALAAFAGVATAALAVVLPAAPVLALGLTTVVVLAALAVLPGASPSTPEPALDADFVARRLGRTKSSLQEELRRLIVKDVGSLLTLHDLVEVRSDPPAHGDWVADPETLVMLVAAVRTLPDGAVIAEIGGGLSTIWLGLAVRAEGRGIRVVSLDHDETYGAATRAAALRQGLGDEVDVRVGALAPVMVDGVEVSWYPLALLADLQQIDLLFVDGPPAASAPFARHPAVPLLLDRLRDGALVVLDDTNRKDEQEIVRRWRAITGPAQLVPERKLTRSTVLRVERSG